jgi:hypothetical protein
LVKKLRDLVMTDGFGGGYEGNMGIIIRTHDLEKSRFGDTPLKARL